MIGWRRALAAHAFAGATLLAALATAGSVAWSQQPGDSPTRRGIIRFSGICDASAMAWIDRRSVVVGEDEGNTLHIYAVDEPGPARRMRPLDADLGIRPDDEHPEADIEGAARAGERIYWITSHGRNRNGKLRPNRHRLFATTADSDLRALGTPREDLVAALLDERGFEGLGLVEAAAPGVPRDPRLAPKRFGLNLEALAATPDGRLLIGVRNPRPGGRAILIPLENPDAALLGGEPFQFGEPILLDLGGRGVRAMSHVPEQDAYVLVAGVHDDTADFVLYRWSPGAEPEAVHRFESEGMMPEAVVAADGGRAILVISDDGSVPVEVRDQSACKEKLREGRCACKHLATPDAKGFRARWIALPPHRPREHAP